MPGSLDHESERRLTHESDRCDVAQVTGSSRLLIRQQRQDYQSMTTRITCLSVCWSDGNRNQRDKRRDNEKNEESVRHRKSIRSSWFCNSDPVLVTRVRLFLGSVRCFVLFFWFRKSNFERLYFSHFTLEFLEALQYEYVVEKITTMSSKRESLRQDSCKCRAHPLFLFPDTLFRPGFRCISIDRMRW